MTTPQGRPLHEAGRHGEAIRSPSSLEEDPPKTNSVEKGYDPNYKTYVSVIVLRNEAGYIYYKVLLFTYSSVEGWCPCGYCAVRMPSGVGPSDKDFFPRLETIASKSSEAALFLPWGEGIFDSSPRLSSFAEALIPPVWMNNE